MKHIKYALLALLCAPAGFAFANPLDSYKTIQTLLANPARSPAADACDWSKIRSACMDGADFIDFQGCTMGNEKVAITGILKQSFTGNGADKCTLPLEDGGAVTHTTSGLMLAFDTKDSMTVDTLAATAYDGTMIPGTGVISTRTGDLTSVVIAGAHAIAKDPNGNVTQDCFAVSTAPVLINGKRQDGTFAVSDGAVRVFHQLEQYTSDVKLEQIAWADTACCHPVRGTITEVLSGSKAGTRQILFNSTCGSVTFVDVDKSTRNIDLPACP